MLRPTHFLARRAAYTALHRVFSILRALISLLVQNSTAEAKELSYADLFMNNQLKIWPDTQTKMITIHVVGKSICTTSVFVDVTIHPATVETFH